MACPWDLLLLIVNVVRHEGGKRGLAGGYSILHKGEVGREDVHLLLERNHDR
jgi:hypothetical protein